MLPITRLKLCNWSLCMRLVARLQLLGKWDCKMNHLNQGLHQCIEMSITSYQQGSQLIFLLACCTSKGHSHLQRPMSASYHFCFIFSGRNKYLKNSSGPFLFFLSLHDRSKTRWSSYQRNGMLSPYYHGLNNDFQSIVSDSIDRSTKILVRFY